MILGSSGENIYPEEIEIVINSIEGVEESIVKSENGKIVAIVKLVNVENGTPELREAIRKRTNTQVNKASQIQEVRFIQEPFVKTATQKIKRFLY